MSQPICPNCNAPIPPDSPEGLCPACAIGRALGPDAFAQMAAEEVEFHHAELETLNKAFPQFELIEMLGRGGMGEVYKARQTKLNRLVAIKILPEPFGKLDEFTERFHREAQSLAQLSHPNIVTIYDYGQADGLCYFVMEYVDGLDLRKMIAAEKLTPEDGMRIVPQICDALQFAHEQGIVHRDIKPANILIDKHGRVKIADFGIAKIVGKEGSGVTLTGAGDLIGTVEYMAPEQRRSARSVDHRADIYALGVVFYEMLTGELPMGRFEPPSKRVQVDVRVDEVVLRSMESNPERRYQTAGAVKTEVESINHSATSPAPAPNVGIPGLPEDIEARERVRSAAIALIFLGLANFLAGPVLMLAKLASGGTMADLIQPQYAPLLSGLLLGPVIMAGGQAMKSLKLRDFGMFTAIISMIPITAPLFLVGIPIGIWCITTLKQPLVGAAFRRRQEREQIAPSSATMHGADEGIFSIFDQAWRDWHKERSRWFAKGVQAVLVLIHTVCLICFFATSMSNKRPPGAHRQFTYQVGAFDPWFTFETYPAENRPFSFGPDLFSGSMLFLIVGMIIYWPVWRIEKALNPKAGFWHSPKLVAILWLIFSVVAMGMGNKLGFDALEQDRKERSDKSSPALTKPVSP